MEIIRAVFRLMSRLIGFAIIAVILWLAFFVFRNTDAKVFLIALTVAFLFAWRVYNRFVSSLEGDLSIFVRLMMTRTDKVLVRFISFIKTVNSRRYPISVPDGDYEVVEWRDVESSTRVARALRKGRLPFMLGQFDGKPRFADLAEIGQVFVSAPQRSGKTNLIVQIICTILHGHPMAKKDIDFVFIDITRDLSLLRPLGQYTSDMTEAKRILANLGKEMDRRNTLREKYQLGGGYWYDIPVPERPKMTVLVIDEAIQVVESGGPELKAQWSKLINTGHKNGVLMITTVLYNRGDLIPTEFFSLMYAKIAGYMGTDQALINVIGTDYYNHYKEEINAYVNQKYRFLLCIRGKKPEFFQPIYIAPQKVAQLIEAAVLDPSDWREVMLTIWWNNRASVSVDELSRLTREFVKRHSPQTRYDVIHKVSTLEMLRHFVLAGIARHNGARRHYVVDERCNSYGAALDLWDKYVAGGGLEKKVPTSEEMANAS